MAGTTEHRGHPPSRVSGRPRRRPGRDHPAGRGRGWSEDGHPPQYRGADLPARVTGPQLADPSVPGRAYSEAFITTVGWHHMGALARHAAEAPGPREPPTVGSDGRCPGHPTAGGRDGDDAPRRRGDRRSGSRRTASLVVSGDGSSPRPTVCVSACRRACSTVRRPPPTRSRSPPAAVSVARSRSSSPASARSWRFQPGRWPLVLRRPLGPGVGRGARRCGRRPPDPRPRSELATSPSHATGAVSSAATVPFVSAVAVDPSRRGRWYIVQRGKLLRTIDAGRTWQPLAGPLAPRLICRPHRPGAARLWGIGYSTASRGSRSRYARP